MNLRARIVIVERQAQVRAQAANVAEATGSQQPVTVADVDIAAWKIADQVYRHLVSADACTLSPWEQMAALLNLRQVGGFQHIHSEDLAAAGLRIDVVRIQGISMALGKLLGALRDLRALWLIEQGRPLPQDLQERFQRQVHPPLECRADGKTFWKRDTLQEAVKRQAVWSQKSFDTALERWQAFQQKGDVADEPPADMLALRLIIGVLEAHGALIR